MNTNPSELMQELAQHQIDTINLTEKELNKVQEALDKYQDEASYKVVNMVYYGDPKAQPRAKARRIGNVTSFYDPAATLKQYVLEQLVAQLGQNFVPVSKEISFTARYYRAMPKSLAGKRVDSVLAELGVIRPLSKPDLDNFEKLLYDAVKDVLYTDDGVVVHGDHEKFYSMKPRVEIEVKYRV